MDNNEKQRIYRSKTGNQSTKTYEKTFNGFIMRMYRNMKSRITGIQHKKEHLYSGKELMSKDEFYRIAKESKDLKFLFNAWQFSGYDRKLTPSIDRIEPSKGYTESNIRFITHSENSRLGSINRHGKIFK